MKPTLKKITPSPETSLSIRHDTGKNLLNNWHYHPELELVFIKRSAGTRIVGDHTEYFHHSDLVLLGPDLPHTFNHDKKYIGLKGPSAPEAVVVHFQKDFAGTSFWNMPEMREIRELISLSRQGIRIIGKTRKTIGSMMEKILHCSPAGRIILLMQMLEIISMSKDCTLLASKGYNYSQNYSDNDKISSIYQYTFDNFYKRITVDKVASLLILSPQSFCRYFKQKTGKTYFQFLVEIRIGNACRMLLDNELSVAEICYSCGYNNISHFNHQFKEITGKTPVQYRTEHGDHIRQIDVLRSATDMQSVP